MNYNFKNIIGQEQIKEHLQNALKTGKISHAYIINGEKLSGKKTIAKIFAMALQCENHSIEPCLDCHSCKQAIHNNQPDIITLTHEKPNSIGVDEIRIQINADVAIKPYSSPYKIYIIDEAEKMTTAAQNALLKTLEEPPSYTVIILLVTNIDSMLQTILSRCVVLNMKPVSDDLIRNYLMKTYNAVDYQAEVCVAFARGNVGKAQRLVSSNDLEKLKTEALSIVKYIQGMETVEMVAAIKNITDMKLDINDFLDMLTIWYRDVLLFKATKDANHVVFHEELQNIRKTANRTSYEGLESVIHSLDKVRRRLEANVNFDLAMELLFMDMKENG